MADENVDILISGGGIAGLVAAAAFGHLGYSVLIADPAPDEPDTGNMDLRSTAFLHPARTLLDQIGLWDTLAPHTTPLNSLRVVDSHGWPPEIREVRVFEASDLDTPSFGWNLPNTRTRAELLRYIAKQPNIQRVGFGFQTMLTRTSEAIVTLSNGTRYRAKLVIGADGRASPVRHAAGITAETYRYGQKALAFSATHGLPHDHVSTEIYNEGGAFTTVPLPDHNGQPASAIVWMNPGPRAQALAALPEPEFNAEMSARACDLLGPMKRVGPLNIWPVITQRATHLTAERTALIAEAAHVLPPIGAQGLNTSLHDIAALYDLMKSGADALGTPQQLEMYSKIRTRDIARRVRAIDAFNRICRSGQPAIQAMRSAGLSAIHGLSPLRHSVMKAGLGPR